MNRKIFFLLAILIMTSLACSLGFVDSIVNRLPEEVGETISNPGRIATLVVDEVNELSDQDNDSEGEPLVEGIDQGFGLSDLESFRFTFIQSLDGVDQDGSNTVVTVTNTQEVIKPLKIVHMILESETDVKPLQFFEVYRYGNEVYLLDPKESLDGTVECTAFTENLDIFEPEGDDLGLSLIFTNLELGDLLEESVEINGILTNHYRVNNVEMVNSELTDVDAEIWYAQDGGYVVKFDGSASGESYAESEGVSVSGTIEWEFSLSDVNKIIDIPLPDVCKLAAEGGVNDIPIPETAQEVSRIGSMLSFSSPDEPEVLTDYYRTGMTESGYEMIDETIFDDFFVLTYAKAEETITIMISGLNDGGSDAIITVEVK
jgi:hypothetical protein